MPAPETRRPLALAEFVPLMALLTAIDALSIDAMLPALPAMARDLGVAGGNDIQLVITTMFLGFAVGQMLGGPLSDSIGRKPAIYAGLAVYVVGCLLAILATDFKVMLLARLLQGIGSAMPLGVMVALVRDLYEGATMARVMSFIGTVFIVVPILAPLAGQAVLQVAGWRMVFVMFLVLAVPATVWFVVRQPETLPPERRQPFSAAGLAGNVALVVRERVSFRYGLADGLVLGAFLGYLSSAQQIFQEQYGVGERFVLIFSSLAVAFGAALLCNGTLVERFGMQRMTGLALAALTGLAAAGHAAFLAMAGHPPLAWLLAYLAGIFFCVGIVFGNISALAMEPLGERAGVGSAVIASLTTLLSLPLGTIIGMSFDRTVLPLSLGFAVLGGLALLAMWWAEAGRRAMAARA